MQKQKKTLLLVEDEAIIAMSEKLSLERYGYSVVLAGSGEIAVDAVRTCPEIDLVLMDINLGDGLDGTEAAELILREYDVPILFLSSHSEREVVEKTEKITSYGYVIKNSSITVLDASIKMAFKLFEANYKVERSEEYFRHSFENAALGICYVSMDGKFQRVNKAFQSMLGYSEHELIQMRFNDITHPEDTAIGQEVMAQLIRGTIKKSTFEKRYLRKDGVLFWAAVSTSLVKSKGFPDHFITQVIDISEQRQAEAALRESKETAEMMLNIAAEVIMAEDLQGTITMLNDSGYKIFEYDAPELIGKNYIETFIPPGMKAEMEGYYARRKSEDVLSIDTHEAAVITRTGAKKTIFWRTVIMKDQHGVPEGFLSSGQDITERRVADLALQDKNEEYAVVNEELRSTTEELQNQNETLHENELKLQENERRLKQAEKVARIGNWILQLDTMTMLASDGADEIYGVDFKKASLAEVQKIPLPEYRPALNKALADLVAGLAPYDLEFRIRRPGTRQIIDIHSIATYDRKANVVFGVIQDVTERKQTEEALRQSEQRYKGFLTNLDAGIVVHAADTSIMMSNQKASEILGLSEQQMQGMEALDPAWNFVGADDAPLPISEYPVNRILSSKEPLNDFLIGIRHSASSGIVWVTVNGFPVMDEEGAIREMLISFIDISKRKRAEDKVKSLLAEKELILKEVHHRIKNNMNTMMSLLSLQAGNASDDFARTALLDAAKRMQSMELLYDKLYHSVEFNRLSVATYLPDLVNDVILNFPNGQLVTIEKNIQDFILDVKHLQPLGMILNELLTNSMKYAFQGRDKGKITVSAKTIDTLVTIDIRDDGNGIPESVSFENSNGFGLQLVKALADQLEGTIRIERGNGTNVILEFAV